MKITYVIERLSGFGGMERIMTDKMNYLADHTKHAITLLLLWHDDAELPYPLSPNIRIVRLNVPYIKGGIAIPRLIYRYNRMIKQLSPDITVLTWVLGAVLGTFANNAGKTIYESHQAKHSMRHKWIIDRASQRVDAVVALTKEDAAEYDKARQVCVIPNLTHVHATSPTLYSQKHCVWAGRLDQAKNLPRLLLIWQQLSRLHPDWVLDIYGDGIERANIEQLILEYGIASSVVMHGRCDDMMSAYLSGSIFVLTSKYEGFGIVLIEAMACGLPVVAFDCDYGPRNIIVNNKNGMLIPYDNDTQMVITLDHMMRDENLRKTLGIQAYVDSTCYQPDSIMNQWTNLFNNLCHS